MSALVTRTPSQDHYDPCVETYLVHYDPHASRHIWIWSSIMTTAQRDTYKFSLAVLSQRDIFGLFIGRVWHELAVLSQRDIFGLFIGRVGPLVPYTADTPLVPYTTPRTS